MSSVDRYLKMLSGRKASERFEACEELRLITESSREVVQALEKATIDPDGDVAEAAKRALDADVHVEMCRQLGIVTPGVQAKIESAQREERLAAMALTTTPMMDGFDVERYLGIVSAEVVMGTGAFSEIGAGLADLVGKRAGSFQDKLRDAKEAALQELRERAFELGANAILGVDVEYAALSGNMLMVVAIGTAVVQAHVPADRPVGN